MPEQNPMPEQIYDVFISYSSKDQKIAEGICGYLEKQHIRCFVAYRDIPKSADFAAVIGDSLVLCRMMVVVFSQNFNDSTQVDREIAIAANDHKSILTFRLSDDAFVGAKKYYLQNLNWIDAFPNPDEAFGTLYEDIKKILDIDVSEDAIVQNANTLSHTQEPEKSVVAAHTSNLKVMPDMACRFYIDGEVMGDLQANEIRKFPIAQGEYELKFVSTENAADCVMMDFSMPANDKVLKVELQPVCNKRLELESYVDLGLPSGTLWKNTNEKDGLLSPKKAKSIFKGRMHLPSRKQWDELIEKCKWEWIGDGMKVIGPNGKYVFLPADGYSHFEFTEYGGEHYFNEKGTNGYYLSSSIGSDMGLHIHFNSSQFSVEEDDIISLNYWSYSVRLVQDS